MKSVTTLLAQLESMIHDNDFCQSTLLTKTQEIKDSLEVGKSAIELLEKTISSYLAPEVDNTPTKEDNPN